MEKGSPIGLESLHDGFQNDTRSFVPWLGRRTSWYSPQAGISLSHRRRPRICLISMHGPVVRAWHCLAHPRVKLQCTLQSTTCGISLGT
ncbi:hypothetical protein M6B38_322550 [Iris pallida]|uniref:Uncharacterized protein n=1 Tax=Iris pallida TaxID=29817 RepID=A0AAX6HAM2_IRIPA|nr:hypothetical protein M6B38_322550 [Iris pallida]